jgi:hypothetical protein
VGENKGAAEEGGIVSPLEVRTNPQAMKVTLEDAVSLLSKYVEEEFTSHHCANYPRKPKPTPDAT